MTCTLPEELWNEKIDSRSRVTLRDAIMQIRAALQTEEFFEIKEQAREKMTKLTDL
jgi:DNA-binding SARP family transcriptional activator